MGASRLPLDCSLGLRPQYPGAIACIDAEDDKGQVTLCVMGTVDLALDRDMLRLPKYRAMGMGRR